MTAKALEHGVSCHQKEEGLVLRVFSLLTTESPINGELCNPANPSNHGPLRSDFVLFLRTLG